MGNSVPSSLTIGHQTIKIKGQIGDGGHGHVYRGEDDAGKDYALKVTWVPRDRNGAVANEEAAETASLEQTILKRICPHPNVIEVLDSGMLKEDNEIRYHILIEYCPRTVLGHLTEARKAPSNYLPERDIMLILRDTLSALQHLHAQTPPIAHRDLRVENLLVDVRGRVRLCNFGSCSLRHRSFAASRDIALAKEEIRRRTAPAYRAPEQVDLHLGHMVSERVDIWAVGVLLHKLAFGATPFEDSRGDVQNLAILGGFRVDRLPEAHPYSSGLCALLQLCMNPIPQARPSCAQLLRRCDLMRTAGTLPYWPTAGDAEGLAPLLTAASARGAQLSAGLSRSDRPHASTPAGTVAAGGGAAPPSDLKSNGSSSTDAGAAAVRRSSGGPPEGWHAPASRDAAVAALSQPEGEQRARNGSSSGGGAGGGAQGAAASAAAAAAAAGSSVSIAGSNGGAKEREQKEQHTRRWSAGGRGGGGGGGGGGPRSMEWVKSRWYKLMGGDQQQKRLWVLKTTSRSACGPKPKYVRKIVLALWDGGFNIASFLELVRYRPYAEDPLVAAKALTTLLKALQQGPPSCVMECCNYADFVDDIGDMWAEVEAGQGQGGDAQPETASPHDPAFATLISIFAKAIVHKVHFSQRNPAYSYLFAAENEESEPAPPNDQQSALVVERLLGLQAGLLAVQRQAFIVLACGAPPSQVVTRSMLLPLVDESFLTYVAARRLLLSMGPPSPLSAGGGGGARRPANRRELVSQFDGQAAELQQFFARADEVDEVRIMGRTPYVPPGSLMEVMAETAAAPASNGGGGGGDAAPDATAANAQRQESAAAAAAAVAAGAAPQEARSGAAAAAEGGAAWTAPAGGTANSVAARAAALERKGQAGGTGGAAAGVAAAGGGVRPVVRRPPPLPHGFGRAGSKIEAHRTLMHEERTLSRLPQGVSGMGRGGGGAGGGGGGESESDGSSEEDTDSDTDETKDERNGSLSPEPCSPLQQPRSPAAAPAAAPRRTPQRQPAKLDLELETRRESTDSQLEAAAGIAAMSLRDGAAAPPLPPRRGSDKSIGVPPLPPRAEGKGGGSSAHAPASGGAQPAATAAAAAAAASAAAAAAARAHPAGRGAPVAVAAGGAAQRQEERERRAAQQQQQQQQAQGQQPRPPQQAQARPSSAASSGGATASTAPLSGSSASTASRTAAAARPPAAAAAARPPAAAAAAAAAAAGAPPTQRRVAVARYDYAARSSEQLTFRAGDIIRLCRDTINSKGWGLGELNGRMGWFPADFVKFVAAERVPGEGGGGGGSSGGGGGGGGGGGADRRRGSERDRAAAAAGAQTQARQRPAAQGQGGGGREGGAVVPSRSRRAGGGGGGSRRGSGDEGSAPEHRYAIEAARAQPWKDRLTPGGKQAHADLIRYFQASGITLDFNELQLRAVIGSGAFATVFRATYRNQDVAVKKLMGGGGGPMEKTLKDFKTEAALLSRLRHRNIVAPLGATIDPVTIVMEYCSRGNLMILLNDDAVDVDVGTQAPDVPRRRLRMRYLHTQTPVIIHRDLKSLNVLIDEAWVCKVTDFGLSRFKATSESERMTGQAGTYHWMSPEVINSQHYTEKADVFSFGIIMWEIYTRNIPYDGMQPVQVVAAVITRRERPRLPAACPAPLAQLIQQCWQHDPSVRPSFDDVVRRLERLPERLP